MHFRNTLAALAVATASAADATDILAIGYQSIQGYLCVGSMCSTTTTFPYDADLMINEFDPRLLFVDAAGSAHDRDWMLTANEDGGPDEYFAIEDMGGNGAVFRVDGGTRHNALRIAANGNVGLGTGFPTTSLHIVRGDTPSILFEQSGDTYPNYQWYLRGNENGFYLQDGPAEAIPFYVAAGARTDTLRIAQNGKVGLGTAHPKTALHLQRADGVAQIRVEDEIGAIAPRTQLYLINNGRPEITMANSATGGEWSFGAGTNFILKQGGIDTASWTKTKVFEISPTGDATLAGTLVTSGPTCSGGCDAVFSDTYDLPSISEHADAMFTLGHLPNVGPTRPGAPLNLSQQYGKLLNELEHAHIYIARQNDAIAALAARVAALEAHR